MRQTSNTLRLFFAALGLAAFISVSETKGGSILREVYQGINGGAVSDLTNSPAFPDHPSATNFVTDLFESPTDVDDNYGQRMHGYIIPPVTGNYTFWIASDDGSSLFLSTDENPSNQRLLCSVPGWTASRQWTTYPDQQSAVIRLEAGKNYYIAALQKEGGGGDNLAVRWLRPDGVDEGPIPATYLQPFGISFTPPIITQQPANATVVEGDSATFSVGVQNQDLINYQWMRNGSAISGATGAVLTYGPATLADNGAVFGATLSNKLGSTNSATATLTVTPDVTKPSILEAISIGTTTIQLTFSEPISTGSASLAGNYQVSGGITVSTAAPGTDPKTVLLTTTPLTLGLHYTVTISNVQDRAQSPNAIPPNSSITFLALEFTSNDVGGTDGAIQRIGPGAFDVSGKGSDIGGKGDQFQFDWERKSGDFDVQVRVAGITVSDPFLHAGLMARPSLDTNAAFAGVFSSSPQIGCFFESRASTSGTASTAAPSGGFPVNYPQTWLRLRRSGNVFTGYASLDGQAWTQLGTATVTLPAQIYLGLAITSGNTLQSSTAQFRDYGKTASTVTGTLPSLDREPLGPSSRRTGITFSEIMYHPKTTAEASDDLQFVELYNADTIFEDLSGWKITGGIGFTFPDGFTLAAGDFVVVAANPSAIRSAYGITNVLGPFQGTLKHSGDSLNLKDNLGAAKLEMTFGTDGVWPVAADGAGHSLVLSRPSYGENDPRAWSSSAAIGGSPGGIDPILTSAQQGVVINEFLAHTDLPQLDFIELYNHNNAPVDLSGCYVSDDPATNKFRIPNGTTIPARGFMVFDETQLGFRLDAAGESIYFINPDGTRVLDAVRFRGQENGVATGRSPDGAATFRRLAQPTAGAANAPWRVEDIVINELMYAPISGDSDDEYVELYNRSSNTIDLSDWRLDDGVNYTFPAGTSINAGSYVVIAKNRNRLISNYSQLNTGNTFGNYDGSLKDSGDHVVLTMPDQIASTNTVGEVQTNTIHIAISEVTYMGGGRWGTWANGGGSSLELIDTQGDLLRPSNWADSDETQKADWTTAEFTGKLDNGNTSSQPNRLQVLMEGSGECLVDDIEIFKVGSTNLLSNAGFESGVTGWSFFGNHSFSKVEAIDSSGLTHALHVRSQGDGDTGVNGIRANLATGLSSGATATIRAKVKWLAGWPEVLLRTRGNWIEMPVRMTVPKNLGTPGLPNSRRAVNAGPAIYDVRHAPLLPQANEAVVVTCRVSDPDGIGPVTLRARVDGGTASTITMRDDGTGGDAIAGDGIYSATISGRSAGTLIGFSITATDLATSSASTTFPVANTATVALPSPECYVRWGDTIPFGNFAHYHLWNTSATDAARNNALNNTYRDATLVYGNFRAIYNAGFRDKGSPYHSGGGSYAVTNPQDEPLLGTDERIFRTTGNGGAESTGLRNVVCGWIGRQMGIPNLHAHYIYLYRNGNLHENITEDEESPSRSFAKSWFPSDDEGDLYKIAVWFEFDDSNSGFNATSSTIESFKTLNNEYKLARYRWNWQTRGFGGTANNYTNIFNLAAIMNDSSTNFVPNLLNLVDADEWAHVFAYDRLLGNWDSWTFNVGQNMYAYKRQGDRWAILPWDIDFTLGDGNGASDGLSISGQDPTMNRWSSTPALQRILWRAYMDALNGALVTEKYTPIINARRSSLLKNNISGLTAPTTVLSFLTQRRAFIQNQLKQNDTAQFAITSNNGGNFTSTTSTTVITGTAPFAVAAITVNGVSYPVTWTDQKTFAFRMPLTSATNVLNIAGLDSKGVPIANASRTITVTYKGAVPQPQDFVVINEIHYHPAEANASFVELFNSSTTTPFDLSGFKLDGIGYDFPNGAIIQPNSYLVLAQDRASFAAAYGATIPILGEFSGSLQNDGENLRLIKPDSLGGSNDVLISDVRYNDHLPWPTNSDGLGSSLQLIDPSRGSYRVGNWAATATNAADRVTPGRANTGVRQSLDPFPALWVNEVLPNNVSGPTDNAGEHDPFIELYNSGTTTLDLSGYFLTDNYTNLTQWPFPSGTTLAPNQFLMIWADGQTAQTAAGSLHTSFRLNPTNGAVVLTRNQGSPVTPAVMDYLEYKQLPADRSFGSYPDGEPRNRRLFSHVTAGSANDPVFPEIKVVINEFMASNTNTLVNPTTGKYDDWFELYNAGSAPVDLTSYRLTDNLTNTTQFVIPPGYVIPTGGFLLVWADKNSSSNSSTNADLHVNFKLSKTGKQIGLYSPDGQTVDSVTFGVQNPDISQGHFPDGDDGPLVTFASPTPGGPNVLAGGNLPPTIVPPSDQTATEGAAISFNVQAADPDAGQTLAFSLGVDAPAGASVDSNTGKITWIPTEAQGPGAYAFTVRVTDSGTPPRSATQRIKITVSELNAPPVLDALADRTVNDEALLSFTATAADSDIPANKLSFSLDAGAPTSAAIDPNTGLFTWTPTSAQAGLSTITVRVTDNGVPPLSDFKSFRVTVNHVPHPPVLDLIQPQTVDEGSALILQVHATDLDLPSSTISYSLEGDLPSGITIDATTGVIRWTPTELQGPGNYVIILRATKNSPDNLSAVQSFGITVNEANQPPTLASINNVTVLEGSTVTFKATASDRDLPQQTLVYSLMPGAPEGASIDANTGVFTWAAPDDIGSSTKTISVRVSDSGPGNLSDTKSFTVTLEPKFRAVINEVMYHPVATNAEFIELFNPSSVTTQDLSDVQLTGANLKFAFPKGMQLAPGKFLVVAQNRAAFSAAYGNTIPVLGEWTGHLDRFDTVLSLVKTNASETTVLNYVAFDAALPWPADADGSGASLQLIDPLRDNSRVGNWAAVAGSGTNANPQWQRVVATGTASSSTLYIYMAAAGEVYLDDIKLVAGTDPDVGQNLLANGDFESAFPGSYIVASNLSQSTRSTTVAHSGAGSLHVVSSSAGTTRGSAIVQDLATQLTSGASYTLSYWYLPNTKGGTLTLRLSGNGIQSTTNIAPSKASIARFTPGAANNVTASLPEFPPLWINEVLPNNVSGITDNKGEHEPWIELGNFGNVPVSLAGWSLAGNYTNLTQWPFPSGTVIQPGQFLVIFADGETLDISEGELHTSFRINPSKGNIALSRTQANGAAVVDYLDYDVANSDQAFGRDPNDFPIATKVLAIPTPDAANPSGAENPPPVVGATVAADGKLTLSWPTEIGQRYRVEYRDSLDSPWQVLTEFTASAANSNTSDSTVGRPQRFYRVVVAP